MELKAGYKQTEAGVIPEEWDFSALGDLISEMRGGAPLSPSDFKDSGVKVLPKGGVGRTGWLQVRDSEMQFCSPQYARVHRRNQVDETFTIVVLRDLVPSGPSIGLMVKIRDPETYVLAQGVYGFKTSDRVDPGYLVQLSNTNWYRKLANSIMVGSTQVHITNTAFKRARVPLPTKTEQQAIAEALSDADALIESLDQLIAKKRQIKQGAMQELLTGKRRLPGFGGEWEVKRLAELADIRSGGTPSTTQPQFWDGGVLWCTPTDITALGGFKYLSSTTRTISVEGLKASSAEIIPVHSIVMTSRATIGECAINTVRMTTNQGFKNFVPFDGVDTEFLYYLLITQRQEFIGLCSGSTFLEIGKTQLAAYQVRVPDTKAEQTAIATLLSDMDTELAALESRFAKARHIKQGMMQELLTGRIRLLPKQ